MIDASNHPYSRPRIKFMTIFSTADIPAYACADSLLEQGWRETVAPRTSPR
jgi:hypothetical protein